MNSDPRESLMRLLLMVSREEIPVQTFCDEFERVFNLELDRSSLSELERDVLQSVFDRVVWFSPFPEDRAKVPHYIDEDTVKGVVSEAVRQLGSSLSPRGGSSKS